MSEKDILETLIESLTNLCDKTRQSLNKFKEPAHPTYETWDFKKHMKAFLNGEMAVNCRTSIAACEFLKGLELLGAKWVTGECLLGGTEFNEYKEQTCYYFSSPEPRLYFGPIELYERKKGIPIVEFK